MRKWAEDDQHWVEGREKISLFKLIPKLQRHTIDTEAL